MASSDGVIICDSCLKELFSVNQSASPDYEEEVTTEFTRWSYKPSIQHIFGSIGMFALHDYCLKQSQERLRSEARMASYEDLPVALSQVKSDKNTRPNRKIRLS